MNKKEKQTKLFEFEKHQVCVDNEAYNILEVIKQQLIKKHKKNFLFSDAVKELKNRYIENSIKFTLEEVKQIKTQLKGGNK